MIPFLKMQSLGNDFIILDGRNKTIPLAQLNLSRLADRRLGIGCDQVVFLSGSEESPVMRIINADGSEVEACGNATRCVGWLLMEERQSLRCQITTQAGTLECWRVKPDMQITAMMGTPSWQATELEGEPWEVSVGNPHLVFLVEEVEAVDVKERGSFWEHHPQFPNRTNVEFVQVVRPDYLKMRVWERGVGITQACGTGACASLVAAAASGKSADSATVAMPGGELEISWSRQTNRLTMTGEVGVAFKGDFAPQDYAR